MRLFKTKKSKKNEDNSRGQRVENLRKQMKLTKGCSKELDAMLGCLGIDFSSLEFCSLVDEESKDVDDADADVDTDTRK